VTWTKLGDEYSDAAADLSDAAFRTHVEALGWSNRRLLDLVIPKRALRRFAETADPDAAVRELIASGWWEDRGDAWWIGCRFPEWQVERAVVEHRRNVSAETSRRHRMHRAGDHRLCDPGRCNALRNGDSDASPDTSRQESPGTGRDGYGQGSKAATDYEVGSEQTAPHRGQVDR
jgi:hypothetical protein